MKTLAFLLSVVTGSSLMAAEPAGAFEACKALPKAQHKAIARLAGRGGKPLPEVWTIVVHDPTVQNGLREYTVTAGTVVATRAISDIAQRITEGDVVGLAGIKFDVTQVAELAAAYAEANKVTPVAFDFELKKEGAGAAPLWKVIVLDDTGKTLGDIVVAANSGTLITQTGFPTAPEAADLAALEDVAEAEEKEKPDKLDVPAKTTRTSTKARSTRTKERPGTARRIGGHLQKFFTGKNTIGR